MNPFARALFCAAAAILTPVLPALAQDFFNPFMETKDLNAIPRERLLLIDTRPSWKFALGHIPGAINLNDWEDFTEDRAGGRGILIEDKERIASKLRLLGADYTQTIAVYGDPRDPWRIDGRFFWMFQYWGFERVGLLDGGYDAWQEAGGATERGRAKPRAPSALAAADLRVDPAVAADQDWIRQRLHAPGLVIIDNRTRKEYDGAMLYGEKRGGHIPNAIHIDWRDFFTGKGRLKSRADVEALLKGHGVTPEKEVAVYCTGGVRSAMAYFVFKTLGYKVRNYAGSWWDWSYNPDLPIAN